MTQLKNPVRIEHVVDRIKARIDRLRREHAVLCELGAVKSEGEDES